MRFSLVTAYLLLSILALCQESKNEKESRIKKQNVPPLILESLEGHLARAKKVRFYEEEDNKKRSYEVKLIIADKIFSIEYDSLKKVEDIELIIPFENIETSTQQNIKSTLASYGKYKIEKVQKQFSSHNKRSRDIIEEALVHETGDTIRYEIELEVKQKGNWISYEMLFDSNGKFISKRKVIRRSSEFILY